VTSRLLSWSLGTSNSLTASNTSEALLLIDEPGSTEPAPVTGWGPNAAQILCGSTGVNAAPFSAGGAGIATGCPEYVQIVNGEYVMSNTSTAPSGTATPGANMFAGVVNANQVSFYGIPIMPPASVNVARIYRMTNIKINASALAGGVLAGTTLVSAYISISGSTSVPIYNQSLVAGSVQPGLSTSTRNNSNGGGLGGSGAGLTQCGSQGSSAPGAALAFLRYSENFGTAFKMRTSLGTTVPTTQNVPGLIYNSESGFIPFNAVQGVNSGVQIGLADFGTRLKANFNNIPSGVRIFVTTTNVYNGTTVAAAAGTTSYAQLVISDSAVDTSAGAPTVPAAYTTLGGMAEIVGPPYSAVWEVINTNPSLNENFDFGVYIFYSANQSAGSPALGTATVNMLLAPGGSTSASTGPMPRFADTSGAGYPLFGITQCTTSLLFPFVTNVPGFDTGIAIMNTSQDPFNTKPQAGTCTLNFYGVNAPAAMLTGSIGAGNAWTIAGGAWQASVIAPNFEGYIIAVCNFQMAHGYAFISDLGAQKLAHGYLALVFSPNPSPTSRGNANPEIMEN